MPTEMTLIGCPRGNCTYIYTVYTRTCPVTCIQDEYITHTFFVVIVKLYYIKFRAISSYITAPFPLYTITYNTFRVYIYTISTSYTVTNDIQLSACALII